MTSTISVEISGPIATITFNRPHSLNAITAEGMVRYQHHPTPHHVHLPRLRRVCERSEKHRQKPSRSRHHLAGCAHPPSPPSILILHLTATGKWFCAGTDVKARMSDGSKVPTETTVRSAFVSGVASTHLDTSKAVGRFVLLENAGSPLFRSVTIPRSLSLR